MVCVTHTSQFSTCYAHLSRFGVSNGAQVQQGQVIGYVGCTGSCTGPHLHFETRVNGQAQNPSTYLSGGSTIPGKRATVAGTSSSRHDRQLDGHRRDAAGFAPRACRRCRRAEGEAQAVGPTEVGRPRRSRAATPRRLRCRPRSRRAGRGRGRGRRRGRAEPVAVEAQVAAPAEVAPEPVAVEAQVAAPAEVAPEPVAVEAQVAAPAEVAPRARRRRGAGRRARRGRAGPLRTPPRTRLRSTWPPLPPCSRARSRKVAAGPVGRRSQGGTVEAPLDQSGVFAFWPGAAWRATRRCRSGRRCRSS